MVAELRRGEVASLRFGSSAAVEGMGVVSGESCPECGSNLYRDGRCGACSTRRMLEQRRQMSQRSGPQYDLAVGRGRTGTGVRFPG